eukprot:CAMPEP_0118983492 /NCGR_PEP_ID=MMETSP1173-20130426/35532_1 /TAXON_ID=1034831 /ORGANISM="Rhizochromulina marina cf, Strain CCMP1243" /LENGTH=66 /DNA_ID=CAMNT_0006934073 /DNA_START=71 /DNA_END=267 /DNA_ORIENTATION=-
MHCMAFFSDSCPGWWYFCAQSHDLRELRPPSVAAAAAASQQMDPWARNSMLHWRSPNSTRDARGCR